MERELDYDIKDVKRRVILDRLQPEVDCGRFPIKRIAGDDVTVEVDMFTDGHDSVAGALRYRHESEEDWRETPLLPLPNDRWSAAFRVEKLGEYFYTVHGWLDPFSSWQRDLARKAEAGQAIDVDCLVGAELIDACAGRAPAPEHRGLEEVARSLRSEGREAAEKVRIALASELTAMAARFPDRTLATEYARPLRVVVDRERARFSAWYEMFPRSCAPAPGRHGSFRDCEARLDYVAAMGFDVLYLPPIHPIGTTHRKGRNNSEPAGPGDPGSPWAIGSREGGHTAIHPELGTMEDFRRLMSAARARGCELAMDLAFQCSPDHPWVREHPEWFRARPDGSIQYAENPPKKYEDIVPFDFLTPHAESLQRALIEVTLFWAGEGIRIFRVDNPHTKPFPFWEELIGTVKRRHPETIFLSEAFTRPKVMLRLARLGFTQSYTYFTWRNTKTELTEYFSELTRGPAREFLRPNLWPNTPDILPEILQVGGRPAFIQRLILAATLASSYGIYGPAFEQCESRPREPGSEEYLDSEKYEIRHWNLDSPPSLRDVIARVNRIRRENPALQQDGSLRFHPIENEQLIAYSKETPDHRNVIVVVVNLDPFHAHEGWLTLPLGELGVDPRHPYQAHDLLGDRRYLWNGPRNYVEIDPQALPAQVLLLRRKVRTERDFDYYL